MTIEIGTSDFRTQAGKVKGIFIEPVKTYYNRLPDCTKINAAISNYNGTAKVYYIPPEVIEKYNLPNWLRGCNSINVMHQTVKNLGYDKYCKVEDVPVIRIMEVIEAYNVKHIDFLKIDTEGHDRIILNDYLDTVNIKPKKIQFESNVLSNENEIDKLCERLLHLGYNLEETKSDIVATL